MMRELVVIGVVVISASAAGALAPPLPCEGVVESNMAIGTTEPLGGWDNPSGFVIEGYYNDQIVVDTVYTDLPGPVPELNDFYGFRVVECATGAFVAVKGPNVRDARISLPATEFLRSDLQTGQPVSMNSVVSAVRAVYGNGLLMRETAQTCGCAAFFPELGPAGQTPFENRTDTN
jgi:hypothetical protein